MTPFDRGRNRPPSIDDLAAIQRGASRLVAENLYQGARSTELLPLLREEARLKIQVQLADERMQAARARKASLAELAVLQERLNLAHGEGLEGGAASNDLELAESTAAFDAASYALEALRLEIRELDGGLRTRFGLE